EIQIRCEPVVFEAVDERGAPAPQSFDLLSDDKSLFRKPPVISTLTMWLPIGLSYRSSWGEFSLAADGKLQVGKSRLSNGVQATKQGLRKVSTAQASKLAAKPLSDVIALPATKPVKMYAPLRIEPGQPLLLAVDRIAYEDSFETPVAADHFSVKQP